MIVGSFQVLPSDVGLNGPNAFDSSNSAAGISALIDHFRFVGGPADFRLLVRKQVFDDALICCGSARARR